MGLGEWLKIKLGRGFSRRHHVLCCFLRSSVPFMKKNVGECFIWLVENKACVSSAWIALAREEINLVFCPNGQNLQQPTGAVSTK